MPDAEQMYDLAALAFAAGIDGASWYPWRFDDQYSDYLSKHPELFDTVRHIYDTIVLPYRERVE